MRVLQRMPAVQRAAAKDSQCCAVQILNADSRFKLDMEALQKYVSLEQVRDVCVFIREYRWYLAATAAAGYLLLKFTNRPRNLPPGPRGLPFIGAPWAVTQDMHEDGVRMSKQYDSDLVSVNVFGQLIVLLNSKESLRESLIARSEEFAHKPMFDLDKEFKDEIFNSPYNEEWKANKKFATTTLRNYGYGTKKGEEMILHVIDDVNVKLGQEAGQDVNVTDVISRATGCVAYNLLLGKSYEYNDVALIELLDLHTRFMNMLLHPDTFAETRLPSWLSKFLFWNHIKRRDVVTKAMRVFIQESFQKHIDDFDPDNPRDVVDAYIKERGVEMDTFRPACNVLSFAGDAVDTLASVITSALFYLAKHQDVQSRVQSQLDAVIGSSLKVTMKDKPQLPLIVAVVYESARVVTPLATLAPRLMTETTTLMGYTLPKDALVFGNVWSVHRNKKHFKNPERFDIEHFLESDGSFKSSALENWLPFGAGRRMCMGEMLGKMELFLVISNILLKYKIRFAIDFVVPNDNDFVSNGFTRETKPYRAIFTGR